MHQWLIDNRTGGKPHAPIMPKFLSGSNHEIIGDYSEK